jgi:hypothetical protein
MGERLKVAMKAGLFYAAWYPKQWLPLGSGIPSGVHPKLAKHLRYAAKTSRRLARRLFHAMAQHGPKLEREQVLLGRFVEIGAELFAITATCSRANSLARQGTAESQQDTLGLAEYFCDSARLRIARHFDGLTHNTDRQGYKVAQTVLKTGMKELEDGIVRA